MKAKKNGLIETIIWNDSETTIYFEHKTLRCVYLPIVYKYCIKQGMQVDKVHINSYWNYGNDRECISIQLISITNTTL